MNNFAVFILTHGRPGNIKTLGTLRKSGYTGKIYYIVDDADETKDDYIAKFGEDVHLFNKEEIAKTFDLGINNPDLRAIIYARNASFDIAKKIGLKYFIQLDDDYTLFRYKFDMDSMYGQKPIKNLDKIFALMLEYFIAIPALSIAFSQSGDFIGGGGSALGKGINTKRKAMNSFFCSVDRRFTFVGNINEDVNTYVSLGNKGELFLTIGMVSLNQATTQGNSGGMTGVYLDKGTYFKSFYTVMYAPSCVRIGLMGPVHKRIHHKIDWNNAVSKILPEQYKK